MSGPVFFFTAAEHSGDALGAALIGELKKKYPGAEFVGVGGPRMKEAGCRIIADPTGRATMLLGIFSQVRYWSKLLKRIKAEFRKVRPVVHVPIDSSAINLRIARAARAEGIAVCYYVSPQVWASRPGRVKKIRRYVDTLCCVYPFEEGYLRERGVNAVYVGHPMFDESGASAAPSAAAKYPDGEPKIVLMPGSRKFEVASNLPVMAEAARETRAEFPKAAIVIAAPSAERAEQIHAELKRMGITGMDVRVEETEAALAWADVALVKSGTGVLQAAKYKKAMAVVYVLAPWKMWIARRMVTTKFISLVNILAGREVVREFVGTVKAEEVAEEMCGLIADLGRRGKMERELGEVVAGLWPREGVSAAERVAAEVGKLVKNSKL